MKFAPIVALAALAPLTLAAPSRAAAPSQGEAFLEHAIKGDNAEIKLGALARKKGATKDVREFGRLLRHDHLRPRHAAAALAKQMGVAAPSAPSAEGKTTYQRLAKLSGARFDRQFLALAVTDQKKDIAAFGRATRDSNAQIAKLAKQTLPTLENHLKIAHRLQVRTAPEMASR